MSCFLFDKIIFGPVQSRRLGVSLGINLLPKNKKICTFDCVYCECGWTKPNHSFLEAPYSRTDVKDSLEEALRRITENKSGLDSITFGGNGEPTIHPSFSEIVDDAIILRDTYFPEVKISVLSNATQLDRASVVSALKKVDSPILKLDAGSESTFQLINKPIIGISLNQIISNLTNAHIEKAIIQSLFLRGHYKGIDIDNTTESEINLWLKNLQLIKPRSVMIYGIARETPAHDLVKIPKEELESIAEKVRTLGIKAEAF